MGSVIIAIDKGTDQLELLEYLRNKGLKPQLVEDEILEDLALAHAIETGETKETVDTDSFIDSLINATKD